ncbi:TerD family protein [Streptomyces sp. NPDC057638]|uniref:TerD family protein n=1 Tax=Streptomyces sp. NPDC057638 TaxID=3346190 RepID=UPI00368AE8A9
MTAELVRGQNHPLPDIHLEIRVSAGHPVVACVTCVDEGGTIGESGIAHPGAPAVAGISLPAELTAEPLVGVDLAAVPAAIERVHVVLALPEGAGGPLCFGASAAPFVTVVGRDGGELASFTITGLDRESALIAIELYRRQGGWKVRAVGQGYGGGLPELLADQRVYGARERADEIQRAATGGLSQGAPASLWTGGPGSPGGPGGVGGVGGVYGASVGARPGQTPAAGADSAASGELQGAGAAPSGTTPSSGLPGALTTPTAEPPGALGSSAGRPQAGASAHGPGAGIPASPPPVPSEPADAPPGDASGPGAPVTDTSTPGDASGGRISYSHPRRRGSAPPPPPVAAPAAEPGRPARPVAGDATGWSMEERLYNQVWAMFEDLARTVAAYRSAVEFAESRLDQELDQALSHPYSRVGPEGEAAREAARMKCEQLTMRAREVLDRDLAQLTAESEVVEPALPPAFARWDNPVWHAYRVPMETPMALRLGDLHLPETPELAIPFLVRLPLERGLWIDSGRTGSEAAMMLDDGHLRRLAMECAVTHAARLLAVHPPGDFTVHVIDPAGTGAAALAPLVRSGALAGLPAHGAQGVRATLARLTQRVDLVSMAVRGGAPDALPPDLDTSEQLLIVHDFPHGFDDRAVTQLRYLADEGPAVGVHLMMVADREDASAYGPVLDPLWRSLLRITPVPDDHLADPWVRHAWTYQPPAIPMGSQVLSQVLDRVTAARRSWGR